MQPDHLSRSANVPAFRCEVAGRCRRWPPSGAISPWAAGAPARLLLDLVILTARLAGRRWLEAHPDSVAVFTALYRTRMPRPLASSARSLLAFC